MTAVGVFTELRLNQRLGETGFAALFRIIVPGYSERMLGGI